MDVITAAGVSPMMQPLSETSKCPPVWRLGDKTSFMQESGRRKHSGENADLILNRITQGGIIMTNIGGVVVSHTGQNPLAVL